MADGVVVAACGRSSTQLTRPRGRCAHVGLLLTTQTTLSTFHWTWRTRRQNNISLSARRFLKCTKSLMNFQKQTGQVSIKHWRLLSAEDTSHSDCQRCRGLKRRRFQRQIWHFWTKIFPTRKNCPTSFRQPKISGRGQRLQRLRSSYFLGHLTTPDLAFSLTMSLALSNSGKTVRAYRGYSVVQCVGEMRFDLG